jgi:hypothetical protein
MYTRLKYSFELVDLDDSQIAIPVGNRSDEFHGIIKLNETAAFILSLLKEEITEEQIVSALFKEYSISLETLKEDVHSYLSKFRERGILV